MDDAQTLNDDSAQDDTIVIEEEKILDADTEQQDEDQSADTINAHNTGSELEDPEEEWTKVYQDSVEGDDEELGPGMTIKDGTELNSFGDEEE